MSNIPFGRGWFPQIDTMRAWRSAKLHAIVRAPKDESEWNPAVKDFKKLIDETPELYIGFGLMFARGRRHQLDAQGSGIRIVYVFQPYITQTATCALIFIDADQDIGPMCFVAVGMSEVSTCELTVAAGETVEKGDQLGMFHHGELIIPHVPSPNRTASHPPHRRLPRSSTR